MNQTPEQAAREMLLPCPFCDGTATLDLDGARRGTSRQSCIVVCTHCGARLESNEEGEQCGGDWNTRHLTAFRDGAETAPKALRDAAQRVVGERFDTFKAGNGRKIGVQDDSGEKCWIVPFDPMFDLEKALNDPTSATLAAIPADELEAVRRAIEVYQDRMKGEILGDMDYHQLRRFLARLGPTHPARGGG